MIIITRDCKGCSNCAELCCNDAIIEEGYGYTIDQSKCIDCGACLDADCAGDCIMNNN